MKKDTHNNFIKYGALFIKELKVVKLIGDINSVDGFLQGQVTSDHTQMVDGSFQLSSICNHKGQVIADFIINKDNNEYRLVINSTLKEKYIATRPSVHPLNKYFPIINKTMLKKTV